VVAVAVGSVAELNYGKDRVEVECTGSLDIVGMVVGMVGDDSRDLEPASAPSPEGSDFLSADLVLRFQDMQLAEVYAVLPQTPRVTMLRAVVLWVTRRAG
jgi:hypothetical protein